MHKPVVAVLAIASVAAVAAWAAESLPERKVIVVPGPPLQDDSVNYRKPLLMAAGTQPVGKGQERITIPVDGVAYEVVVTKPGLGAMIPLEH